MKQNSFFGDHTGANGVDFAGFVITSIDLVIDTLSFDTPGSDPNGDSLWTDVTFGATFVVNGNPAAVPEPTTSFMLGIGLLCTIVYRSVKRK